MASNFFADIERNAAKKREEQSKSPLRRYYEANPGKVASNSPAASGRYSGPDDFASAMVTALSSKATEGPAAIQTTTAPEPTVQPIQTPELDKATGNGWEDTQALGRELTPRMSASQILARNMSAAPEDVTPQMQAEYQKAAQAEREYKTRRRNAMAAGAQAVAEANPLFSADPDEVMRTGMPDIDNKGNTLGAFNRGFFGQSAMPEGMTEAEQKMFQRGSKAQDVFVNAPAIIAEFGGHAVDTFLHPEAEHTANALDPEIVQRAAEAGNTVGLPIGTGITRAGGSAYQTVAMVEDLFTKNNIHDPLTERALQQWGDVEQNFQKEAETWSPGKQKIMGYATEAARMIPGLVLAWLTGGASEAGTIAPEAVQLSTKLMRYFTGLMKNPVFYDTAMQVTGLSYQKALEKGHDEKSSAMFAILNGLLNGATEVGGVQAMPANMVGKKGIEKFLEFVTAPAGEIKEEWIQGAIEQALENYVLGEDNAIFSKDDPEAIFSIARGKEEAEGAAVMSLLLGGGNLAVDAAINAYNNAAQQQNPLTQAILANEQGQQEQGDEFNAPQAPQGAEQVQGQAGAGPVHVGRATTIQNPYSGQTPTQNYTRTEPVPVTAEQLTAAQNAYNQAVAGEQAGQGPIRTLLSRIYSAFKGPKSVAVNGMEYSGDAYLVDVPNSLPGKLASQNAPAESFSILDSLTSIIQNGEYLGSGQAIAKNGQPKKSVTRYDYFESEIIIDGRPYVVKWEVENVPGGNNYKTHRLVNIEIDPTSTDGPPAQTGRNPIDAGSTPGGDVSPSPTSSIPQSAPAVNGENATSPIAQAVLNNEQQAPQPGQLRSQSEANTIQAVDEQQGAPEDVRNPLYYTPRTEAESVAEARAALENGYEGRIPSKPNSKLAPEQSEALTAAGQRLGGGHAQAIADMQGVPVWTTIQQDMSTLMLEDLARDAKATGDWRAYEAWRIVDQQHGEEIARTLQARGKRTRSYTDFLDDVADYVDGLDLSQETKDRVLSTIMPYAQEYTAIQKAAENGASQDQTKADLIDLIERVSGERGTGTLIKSNLHKLLERQDSDYLSSIARAQFKSVAYDNVPVSIGAKIKTWQTIAQLLKATTAMRNLGGNLTFGIMDAMVGDTFGVALDALVGTQTGARSVAIQKSILSSTFRKAAWDAARKSALEVALDVDMAAVGDNVDPENIDRLSMGNKFNPGGRSNKMNGGTIERFLSRLEQLLSYSLVTSDRFFRGGIEAENTTGLNRLNAGNEAVLNQVSDVAGSDADYKLFQNKSLAATASRATHDFLNRVVGTGGEVNGALRSGGFGVGDLTMPYATVPANLGVKPFEYSPLGIVTGGIKLAKVLKSAQSGHVNLQAQHNAVMEISRGMTGVPIAILFATLIRSGIVKRSDDEKDYDVTSARQTEGRRETQWNLDATLRWLQGGSKEWQEGDKLISLNWMEPMNAFMDIGALFADLKESEDDPAISEYAKNYAVGAAQAFLEMPLMDGLQSAIKAVQNLEEGKAGDKLAQFAESTVTSGATGMIPGLLSQLARTLDPTNRDTKADTFTQRFANALMNATPGLRTLLPEKLDSLGNPITNDNPLLNALNNFILPGQVAEYAPNDVVQALDEVYEATGKSNFYPDYKPPASFSYDDADYKLDTEEKRLYQQTFGNTYEELVRNVTQSAEYDSLTAAEKAAVFSEMRSMATAEAKGAVVEGRGGEYTSDYDKVSELSDIPGYFSTKAMFSTASNEKNRDYERMPEILEAYGSLPEDVKEKLKAGNTSNMDELYDAWKGGVSAENWFKAYDATKDLTPYGDHKEVTDWQKYQAMANVSTDEDMDIMLRGYLEGSSYDKYMAVRTEGVSARAWADAMAEAGKVDPLPGKDTVAEWQKYQAIASGSDAKTADAIFKANLADSTYARYTFARDAGITPQQWADTNASVAQLPVLEGNKDVANWQKVNYVGGSNMTDAQKDALMILYFDKGEGNKVATYDKYMLCRSAGFAPVHIAKFYEIMQTAQGVDKDGDGKTDSGTKKKAILAAAMAYGFNEKNAERLYNMWQNGHW